MCAITPAMFRPRFGSFFLIGRLAVFGLAAIVATVGACVRHVDAALHTRTIPARIERVSLGCRMPDSERDADCAILEAMNGKASAAERHTVFEVRYLSPNGRGEFSSTIDRPGDLTDRYRVGGALPITVDTRTPGKVVD